MKKYLLLSLLLGVCMLNLQQTFAQNAVLLARGSRWKYLDNNSRPTNWQTSAYDDAAWLSGNAPLGYGDGQPTIVSFGSSSSNKFITALFRKTFFVPNKNDFSSLTLNLRVDDGAVIYLNGTEVRRVNMPTGTITNSTLSNTTVDGSAETTYYPYTLNLANINNGSNVIAIEVHQRSANSSDITLDLDLTATYGTNLINTGATWRYLDDNTRPINWQTTAFSDASWSSGPAPLGYGDSPATTVSFGSNTNNKHITTLFRNTFNVADPTTLGTLQFRVQYDDGAVIYLNGSEIKRLNMPTGTITNSTLASSNKADEVAFDVFYVLPSQLVAGNNTIAVEVHQNDATSSDKRFDLGLLATNKTNLIDPNSSWKFFDAGSEPTNWKTIAFNDASWSTGIAPLGYPLTVAGLNAQVSFGTDAANKRRTTYFRKTITVDETSIFTGTNPLTFRIRRDDGIIVYINGVERVRSNMPTGAVSFSTLASSTVGGADENTYYSFNVPATDLVSGTNVIAVEVHQATASSSDKIFDLQLEADVNLSSQLLANEVKFLLSGALTSNSINIRAGLTSEAAQARVVYSTSSNMANPLYSSFKAVTSTTNFVGNWDLTGLNPNTTYYYRIEADGVIDQSATDQGKFTTTKTGQFSFRFVVTSCGSSLTTAVWQDMLTYNPLFFLDVGDLHYYDPNSATLSTHRNPYDITFSAALPNALFRNVPMAYVWDDHDYCGNNNGGNNLTGTANARQAYREYVPHYPLAAGSGNNPIYQSFNIGRVRFILTDSRSMRASGTMWGSVQKQWVKDQIIAAKNANQFIMLITSVSPYGNQSDNWGGYSTERTEMFNFLRDNQIINLTWVSGDAHMMGYDNGSNAAGFYSGGSNPFLYPVIQAGSLSSSGSYKGGTYSGGYRTTQSGQGQFVVVDIVENVEGPLSADNMEMQAQFFYSNASTPSQQTSWLNATSTHQVESPLSVSWLNFTATSGSQGNELQWATASEINCDRFEVQRSADGKLFETIGSVSCAGTTNKRQQYQFLDDNAPSEQVVFYKLKQLDTDGKYEYSKTISLNGVKQGFCKPELYPNPVNEQTKLYFCNDKLPEGRLLLAKLYNSNGQLLAEYNQQFSMIDEGISNALQNLPTGTYTLMLSTVVDTYSIRVIKQ